MIGGGWARRALAGLTILGISCAPAPLVAQDQAAEAASESAPWEVIEQRPADGEQCLVCRQPIGYGEIVEVRYKGRTFHVSEGMLEEFQTDPERYFESMQAHSALFDESSMEAPPMKTGWLTFGLYVLVGLIFGAACSYAALDRGLPALRWFFAGLLVNVLALAAVLVRSPRPATAVGRSAPGLAKIPSTHTPASCPSCGTSNHPSASACSECGQELQPRVDSEVGRA